MAQYLLFLSLAPLALAGSLSALLLPRMVHSYQRFAWLRVFLYVQLVLLINNVAELLARDPSLKQSLAAIDYLFLGSGPSLWLLFSLEYTGLVRHLRPWQALLFVPPIIVCGSALAQGSSGLVWRNLQFARESWVLVMRTGGYGPVALLFFAVDYTLLLTGSFILVRNTILSHKLYRRQTLWLLSGVALPLLSHFMFVMKIVPGWNKDFSAIAGSFGAFCFSIGCLRYKLFAVRPIPRETILRQMSVGMIVIDPDGIIIDLNQSACALLGKSEIGLLGSSSSPILARLESRRIEVSRHPLLRPDGRVEAWHLELRPRGSPAAPPSVSSSDSPILSLGELRVVEMLALNLANKEISQRLGVSVNTVKFHLANAYRKTGTHCRAELVHRIAEIMDARTE